MWSNINYLIFKNRLIKATPFQSSLSLSLSTPTVQFGRKNKWKEIENSNKWASRESCIVCVCGPPNHILFSHTHCRCGHNELVMVGWTCFILFLSHWLTFEQHFKFINDTCTIHGLIYRNLFFYLVSIRFHVLQNFRFN